MTILKTRIFFQKGSFDADRSFSAKRADKVDYPNAVECIVVKNVELNTQYIFNQLSVK